MKIIKILGIAAGLHAIALILIFANPGCSYTKAAATDAPPISAAPGGDSSAQGATAAPEPITVRYSPTRPGTAVASALESQPVSDVTPATTYVVARGDNLWTIAKKNQLSRTDLAVANHLSADAVLRVGQKLIIPAKRVAAAQAPSADTEARAAAAVPAEKPAGDALRHVVRPGETLGAIARQYGVKAGDIAEANNITDPRKIHPGQELIVPAKSAARQAKASKPAPSASAPVPSRSAPAAAAPAADQDLDSGLKPANDAEVPVVKIEDSNPGSQPKNP
jgi:LysM repeat protein